MWSKRAIAQDLPDISDILISTTCPECGEEAIAYMKNKPYIRYCSSKHSWKPV